MTALGRLRDVVRSRPRAARRAGWSATDGEGGGREAEAIGADIADHEQAEISRAVQFELPEILGEDTPILYIEMDGTGVPVTGAETAGRKGKAGGPARTREVKLGCVFTQTSCDDNGRALRDEDSTSYTGAIEDAAAFGRRIWSEALRRGWRRARKKVVIGDGASWIWNLSHEYFPGAVEIVDLYHAREHLWGLAAKLFPRDEKRRCGWARRLKKKLDAGRIEPLVAALRSFETQDAELAHQLLLEADYFQRNAERMRYDEFRRQGLFVGSGGDRGGLSHGDCESAEAFGNVLERARRERDCGFALRAAHPPPFRRLLGQSRPGGLSVTNLSHTPCLSDRLRGSETAFWSALSPCLNGFG